jgi:hypothetical protein
MVMALRSILTTMRDDSNEKRVSEELGASCKLIIDTISNRWAAATSGGSSQAPAQYQFDQATVLHVMSDILRKESKEVGYLQDAAFKCKAVVSGPPLKPKEKPQLTTAQLSDSIQAWRKQKCEEMGRPAYQIFPNAVMLRSKPSKGSAKRRCRILVPN